MGLGLPDGGHLTHGYYACPMSLYFFGPDANVGILILDCQEEEDYIIHLLPVIPLRRHPGFQPH
jgi:hypothetical protein